MGRMLLHAAAKVRQKRARNPRKRLQASTVRCTFLA
jgi:hypothetical protein